MCTTHPLDPGDRMPTLPAATDAELTIRAADGEQAAFTALFDRYADRVHDHVARWSRDAKLAADATREAFAALLDDLDALRDGQPVLVWLLRTARTHAVEQLRSTQGGRDRLDTRIATALLAATPTDPGSSPEVAAFSHATAELVWELAASLDDRTFTVLDLHVRQGLDVPDIASVIDIPRQDAGELVDRMRDRLDTLFGAMTLLRLPSRDCVRLEGLRTAAPDPIDLVNARRIQDHAEQCVTCGPRRARAASPLRVYGALALVRAPVSVRNGVMAAAAEHFGATPRPTALRRGILLGAGLLVLLGLIGGIASALRSNAPEPAEGPPTAAAEPVASPSPSPEPEPSPAPTLETLASTSPEPSPEPSVTPEPSPTPEPTPSPSPTPTPEPSPSPQPLAVSIDQPQAGELFAATAEDEQGRQAARVAVGATVTGGGEDTSVIWTSDRTPDDVLLATSDGEVLLWLSEPCTDTPHVLTATASDDATGEVATETVEVLVTETCTEPLTVSIDEPGQGATVQRNADDGTVSFRVAATASDDDVTWVWTTDRARDEPLLEAQRGEVSVVIDDCTPSTSFTLFVEVERASDGSTAQHERDVKVDCGE